ncbi:trihelix transcription factor ASR3-like isoform X1 [Zingiber officinale]|uniref:Myb-like domain-containing protein n=1 Tax=Zingiber officinale TaxID=94328 RepID=A0A8J5G9U9_ZINOF|nr:trihelix transcription factor ASR3-like isoform X1 [Zingiber officinale]KAG6503925.1 hypothetical protein ZIOFF_036249 [Zingiber officinale]
MEESGRVYRKGNWSLHETMILIEAKKVDYSRRTQRTLKESGGGGGAGSSRPQEMRWKWVEDCCWKQGCHRSQNQCNDRWDNLMRDYKKVRSYEASSSHDPASPSYWKLERHERKERNLPANLLPEIYEALSEVVQMRAAMAEKPQGGGGGGGGTPLVAPSIDSEDSERSISASPETKRKRGRTGEESSSHRHLGVGSAISKCASIIADALQEGEEKEGMRHKDLLGIEQRKAKLEETKSQVAAQSMDGLATAVNKLATSILGLVTARVQKLQK